MKKYFILCADLHIRDDQPRCRTDRFKKTLWKKFKFLKNKQKELNNCPIIVAGDIFHHWKATPHLINKCLKRLPNNMWCIAGNHDLPHHNIDQIERSALQTLVRAKKIQLITGKYMFNIGKQIYHFYGYHYGQDPINVKKEKGVIKIAIVHRLIIQDGDDLWRQASAKSAKELIKNTSGYDLILTGDNHKTFTVTTKKTRLVNPGSFTRQTAAQMQHKPCFYVWESTTNEIEKIVLPHDKNAISRKHLKREQERNERMQVFVDELNEIYEIGLNYKDNLEKYFESNKENKQVKKMVWQSIEGDNNHE